MKNQFLTVLFVLLMASMASIALAVESPHTATLVCTGCHDAAFDMSTTYGVDNLCLKCHKPELMTKSFVPGDIANPFGSTVLNMSTARKQTSHNWAAPINNPAAGAAQSDGSAAINPTNATKNRIISCASCHQQHATAGNDLLKVVAVDLLCFDCHRVRKQTDVQKGTHPVDFDYATSKVALKPGEYQPTPVNANPANPTSAMKLTGGKVLCSTCHGVHFTDSNARTFDNASSSRFGRLSSSQGFLLRTDMRGGTANAINICTNCHAGKMAHNNKGQNIQCADCHAGHVDTGDGSAPNVWLVRRYMNYSGGVKLDSYRRKVLNQGIGALSNFAGDDGVCQACHSVPAPGGSYPSEHASTDPNVCRSCHTHNASAGSFSADCKGCHGFPPQQNIAGGPLGYAKTSQYNYATSGVFKDEATTGHLAHAGKAPYSFSCYECHAGNKHATGNFQQVFIQKTGILAATGGAVPMYNASGTCATVYCHSNGAPTGGVAVYKTPAWANAKGSIIGTAGECNACHDASPATNAHSGHLSFGFACELCHSVTVSGSSTIKDISKHVNGVKDVLFSGTAALGGNAVYNSNTTNCTTLYCHSNGSRGALVYVNPPAWTSGAKFGCNGCHGISSPLGAPDYANGGPGTIMANSHNAHTAGYASTTVCSNCHFTTVSSTTANTLTAASKHLSGSVDVVFNPAVAGPNASYNPVNKTCTNVACHGNALAQWGGKGGCLGCHTASVNNRAAITSQFSGNSHHIQGVTVSETHCYQCHWEANSDGSINHAYHHSSVSGSPVELVVYGASARPTTYTAGTTAVQYTANGVRTEMAKINAVCLGCHSDQNNATTPFGDGKTPKSYAWDGTSIATKYGSKVTTTWGKYNGANTTPKNTVTKALSAHGNLAANQRGWDLNETWPNKGGNVNVLCFDCHNSHGSTVSGTTTSYTSTTTNGGILKDTVSGKGGYAMTYKPTMGGTAANHNAYNPGAAICFDCHTVQNPGTTPWGYQGTFGATQAVLGYLDTPYFGAGTFGFQQRYLYKAATPNVGGHFGASSSLTTQVMGTIGGLCTPCHDPHGVSPTLGANQAYGVPLLKGTWMTSPYKEDVAPKVTNEKRGAVGEDGSKVGYSGASTPTYHIDQNTLDAGTTTSSWGLTVPVWNFASTKRVTETVDQFGGLCLKCHPKTSIAPTTNPTTPTPWRSVDRIHNSVKGWGTYGKNANNAAHSFTCSKCHSTHNSSLPRLAVTNCLDFTHRGQVATGGPTPVKQSIRGEEGAGQGGMPAGGGVTRRSEGGSSNRGPFEFGPTQTCHDTTNTDAYPANQRWNVKTPWTSTATPPPPPGGGGTTPPAGSAPTVPVLIAEPDLKCSYSCSATLNWNASLNGNAGAATQYQVQVSRSSSFSTVQYTSGWISTTSYTPSVSTGYTYYWRVQARDKTKTTLVSAWSTVDSFIVSR